METWLESVAALPMATSQELRWGVLLGMAIGGSLVALINYIRDCRRHHIDKLVEEKVERILALVEERRGEVERRVREESGNDAAQQAKPQESSKPASPSPAASTSTTSSSGGGSNNAGWEQKRPYAPASSSPKSSLLKTATTTRSSPLASSASATSPSPSSSSSSSSSDSSESTASASGSPTKGERPKLQKSYSTATIWRGEDEATLRKRQNLERQSSMQKLYGMEAEIAKKIEKKTEPLIEPMCKWLYEVVGEEATDHQFPDSLKSGRLLCALMNKLWPGIIPDVHTRPIALLERENIQKYLDACVKMGIRKDDLFGVSDLYEEKYLAGVVQNVYAVARYVQQRKSWTGPILQPPAIEKATAD